MSILNWYLLYKILQIIRSKHFICAPLAAWSPSSVVHMILTIINTDFWNALLSMRVDLFGALRVVVWAVAEPQGSQVSSDASVAWGHNLPCGHVGGWESHPEQSPTAVVQKLTGPERVAVEQSPDRNAFFHTRECGEAMWPPVHLGKQCLYVFMGVIRFLVLLLQVYTLHRCFPPQEKSEEHLTDVQIFLFKICILYSRWAQLQYIKEGIGSPSTVTYCVHIHSGIFLHMR